MGVLGEYELLSEVGQGGMGVVYRARHRGLKRIVALKVSRAGHAFSQQETHRRFHIEAAAIAKLDHPNIVPIYEMGECHGQLFFSMAFVEGESLARTITGGPLPPRRAAELIQAVARAVAHAHAQGVIHRDLKPDNILLDAAGQPRITDFGLAKCADADPNLTQTGEVIGTPNYMAPEQVQGMAQAGPLADVYSLGATLYCLLTGRPPFQSASTLETVKQVADRDPVPPRQLNPAVDRDLETVCLKCLEKRPERRYASAAALADDLTRFLERRSIHARRTHALEKTARWCRRNPLAAGLLAGVVAIFFAAFALVSWSYWRAEDARREAERKGALERWGRYRSHMTAVASALQLNNLSTARRFLEAAPEEHRGWEWRHFISQLDGAETVLAADGSSPAPLFALSPDGSRIVLGTPSGEVQWRDLASGRPLGLARKAPAEVSAVALSPDGKRLGAGTTDGGAYVWAADSPGPPLALGGFRKRTERVLFDPAGARLLASSEDRTVRLWDLASGERLPFPEVRVVGQVEPTPDFSRLVFGNEAGLMSVSIDRPGEAPLRYEGGEGPFPFFSINPRGTRLVAGGYHPHNDIHVWDLATGKLLRVLVGHKNSVVWVRFSPDGKRLISASRDQTLRLWDAETGALLAILTGHTGPVHQVVYSPDGARLASTSDDGTARLWDAETGSRLGVLRGHRGPVYTVAFSSDGARLVTRSGDGSVRTWDLRCCATVAFRGHASYIYDVAVAPDGKTIASAGWDGKLILGGLGKGQPTLEMRHDAPIVSSVSFGEGGARLVTLSRFVRDPNGRYVTVWDAATGARVWSKHLPHSNYKDARAVFHPRKGLIAVGDPSGQVLLLDATTGADAGALAGDGKQILDVAFHPNGAELAAGGVDGTVRIWNVESHAAVATLSGHTDDVFRVDYSPSGRLLASASADQTVRLWDTVTHRQVAELAHGCRVYGLAFSPDGARLATACADNTIRLWDLTTYQEVAELRGHESYVHAVAFSPDGTRLVSASGDQMIRVWDTLSSRERAQTER